jgi:hypothetical protein
LGRPHEVFAYKNRVQGAPYEKLYANSNLAELRS